MEGSFYLQDQPLFENLSLAVKGAQWTCLLGSSGVGKSTLLRLIAGLKIAGVFKGTIVTDDGGNVADQIAYMAQSDLLFPWLNVRQNVLLGQSLRAEVQSVDRADELIRQVGLGDDIEKRPYQLSGGMRQRVALARTLMQDKPIVLLDEPFSALDARTRSEMQDLAFEVLSNKTVLLVTHDPAEAVRLAHHLFIMTRQGLSAHSLPPTMPAREVDHPSTLQAQAALLKELKS